MSDQDETEYIERGMVAEIEALQDECHALIKERDEWKARAEGWERDWNIAHDHALAVQAQLAVAREALERMGDVGCKCGDIADEALDRLGRQP